MLPHSRRIKLFIFACVGFLLLSHTNIAQQNDTPQLHSCYIVGPNDTLIELPSVVAAMKNIGTRKKAKFGYSLEGEQATLRLNPSDARRFVCRVHGMKAPPLPYSQPDSGFAGLGKFDLNDGNREWQGKGIPLHTTRYNSGSVEIAPQAPLLPGEYAVTMDYMVAGTQLIEQFFSFGVDVNAAPLASHSETAAKPSTPPQGGPTINNDDIIKLAQAKLPDSLIIAKIKSSACAFDIGTEGLVRLKNAGVSDVVLQAMLGGTKPRDADPSSSVRACLIAMNEAKYSDADQYFTSSFRDVIAAYGGIKKFADDVTRVGSIDRIEFVGSEVRGEGAHLRYRIYYKDGKTMHDEAELIQDGGKWKINQ